MSVRGRSDVGPCQDLALQGQGRMAREKKLPGDSGEDRLKQIDSFRTGTSGGGCSCCLGQMPKEGCFLPKAKCGTRI